jgi:hypothetical protein
MFDNVNQGLEVAPRAADGSPVGSAAYRQFWVDRRRMFLSLAEWLGEQPPAQDVKSETDLTTWVVGQLVGLLLDGGRGHA